MDNQIDNQEIFEQILNDIDGVVSKVSPEGIALWNELIKMHPADIAQFLVNIEQDQAKKIFLELPGKLKLKTFGYVSDPTKVFLLSLLPDHERAVFLSSLTIDELTDFFDNLSDEDLKKYLRLLHKRDREKVISLMKFSPESAAGIMHTDVLSFIQDFTIEKCIKILQRLQPKVELHRTIFVTNQDNELLGHINLEDLVLKQPNIRLSSIIKENVLVINSEEDRENVAQSMNKYKIDVAPVVNDQNIFLGVIDSEALVDIIEEEAAEDVYKISALTPIKTTYFETPFFNLFYQRSSILVILLLAQIGSELIIGYYNAILVGFAFLMRFITMIGSTGGNTSSQTSALAIQGLVSGEITDNNVFRFIKREFLMAIAIGLTLGIVSFIRILLTSGGLSKLSANFAVSLSLAVIVIVSVILGSLIPLMLKKLKLDPALSAGPFLATLMDVLGILIYCTICSLLIK